MTIKLLPAHRPKYATPDGLAIDLIIAHPDLGEIPFTARADDAEPLGQNLYQRAMNDEFGLVADYDGPSADEMLADQVRTQRNALLAQLDALVMNPLRWSAFSLSQQEAIGDYRQALLDVPQQANFPFDVVWPEVPTILAPVSFENG